MRRLGFLLIVLAFVGATLSTAGARVHRTVTICHRTGSKTTPYVRLRVSGNVLRTHVKHAADIIPAPAGGCPKTLLTPTSGGRAFPIALAFAVPMAGASYIVTAILADPASFYANVHTSEFPAGAIRGQLTGTSTASFGSILALELKGTTEPDAKGTAVLRIRKDTGMICYRLHVENVTLPTVAAHIHRGGAGVNGPVVFPFTAPGADGNSSGCAAADPALIDEILGNLSGFYVNVHTKEHPAGAIRAQLG